MDDEVAESRLTTIQVLIIAAGRSDGMRLLMPVVGGASNLVFGIAAGGFLATMLIADIFVTSAAFQHPGFMWMLVAGFLLLAWFGRWLIGRAMGQLRQELRGAPSSAPPFG